MEPTGTILSLPPFPTLIFIHPSVRLTSPRSILTNSVTLIPESSSSSNIVKLRWLIPLDLQHVRASLPICSLLKVLITFTGAFGTGTLTVGLLDRYSSLTNHEKNALRVRTFRPFPAEDIVEFAKKNHKLLVIDRSVSFGHAGQLGIEIEAALNRNKVDTPVKTILRGIGGEDVPYTMIMKDAKEALKE